jgi:hypothetical protein
MQLHHTRSQEESPIAVPEEQTRADPQDPQAQEVPKDEEQGEELPECVDHQSSSFKRGKPPEHSKFPILFKQFFIYELYILLH